MNGAIMHTGYVTFLDLIFSAVGGLHQPMCPSSGTLEFFPLNQTGLNTGFYKCRCIQMNWLFTVYF